jgi:uncharacterized protein YggE
MMKIALVVSLLALGATLTTPTLAQTTTETKTAEPSLETRAALVVKGDGTEEVKPNKVFLRIYITGDGGTNEEAAEVRRKNSQRAVALLKPLLPTGTKWEWDREQTMAIPQEELAQSGSPGIVTRSTTSVSFYSGDLANTEKILSALRAENLPGWVNAQLFAGDNREEAYLKALRKAVLQAKARVAGLAEAAGIPKVELMALRENVVSEPYATANFRFTAKDPLPQTLTIRAVATLYWQIPAGGTTPQIKVGTKTADKP